MFRGTVLILAFTIFTRSASADDARQHVRWKRTVIDHAFRSEGVAVADVNQDGKLDIVAGDVWYAAPDWKMHVIRKDRRFDPQNYSESFACFTDDFNHDGFPDVIVVPFPGQPCPWYENPGKNGGPWKQHILSHSACNETPQFVDLFGTGKRVLIMGVQPRGQENMGQMFWLRPGKDPTRPWEHHPISVPSQKGKVVPGTFRYAHGLGVGDVNGDGRLDVLCTDGWWEQPAKSTDAPWTFHAASLSPPCADMYAFDLDGDGKNDIISSSAHNYGIWWSQQKGPESFIQREMLLGVPVVADKGNYPVDSDEKKLIDLVNDYRAKNQRRSVRPVIELCRAARAGAVRESSDAPGRFALVESAKGAFTPEAFFKSRIVSQESLSKKLLDNYQDIGVGFVKDAEGNSRITIVLRAGPGQRSHGIVVWEGMKKKFVSQTHALHFVDINGDGKKDLVTGRRWMAHGYHGDAGSTEPAYLFWFEARKAADGMTTFLPHLIDDDSGIGTQFEVRDINGNGLPDIIIANKRGVYLFEQVSGPAVEAAPGKND
jgi:hypothetical protein